MDGQKIACIVCGGEITVLINDGVGKCVNCGVVYPLDSLEVLTRQEGEPITSQDVANVVVEDSDSSLNRSEGTTQTSAGARQEQASDKPTEGTSASFQWETPFATSALGLLCSMSWIALASIWLKNGLDGFAFGLVLMVLYLVGAIVYAAYYYPSLFTDAPRLTSSKTVGFCNFLFGGWLFGLIWNHNLTIRNKGVSYAVAIVLAIGSAVTSAFLAFVLLGAYNQAMALDSESSVGDEVHFGSTYGFIPIKWRAIDRYEDGRVMLVSVDNVCKYDPPSASWQFSHLRRFLNGDFLEEHFNDKERSAMTEATLENEKSVGDEDEWEREELSNTVDKVFLLSDREAFAYIDLLAGATSDWMTRTTIEQINEAESVVGRGAWMIKEGQFDGYEYSTGFGQYGVRPAVVIDPALL